MTAIPQMECCTMLGIDPKTLRNWLRHAHLHFVAHPTDARLTCLTPEQVQQLATLHARPIAPLATASPGLRQEATPLPSTLSPPCLTQHYETPLADRPFLGRSRTPNGCVRSGDESDGSARAGGPTHLGTPS